MVNKKKQNINKPEPHFSKKKRKQHQQKKKDFFFSLYDK